MDTQVIRCEVQDYIATVTMDRPPVNAVNAQLLDELTWVFDTLSDRSDVRVAILTGAGRTFCAGADIKERAGREPAPGDIWQHNRRARETLHALQRGVRGDFALSNSQIPPAPLDERGEEEGKTEN